MKLRKGDILSIAFILILLLGLGYAFLTQNLLINGSGKIQNPTWNIYWDNVVVNNESVEILDGDQAATINPSNKTSLSYNISLSKPGDFYEFTVDAKNDGSIAGKIDSIESKMNGSVISTLPAYLEYSVTYDNGDAIEVGQLLRSFDKQTYKIRVGYKKDINPSDLPQTNQQLNMTFAVTYVQGKDESNNPRYLYNWFENEGGYSTRFDDPISAIRGYVASSPEELMNLSGYPIFLRHTIVGNKIKETEVGVYDNSQYYYVSVNTTQEFRNMVNYYSGNLKMMDIDDGSANYDIKIDLPNYQMFITDPDINGFPTVRYTYGKNSNYSIFGEKDGIKIGCTCSAYSTCSCETGIEPIIAGQYVPYNHINRTEFPSSAYFIPANDVVVREGHIEQVGAYYDSLEELEFLLGGGIHHNSAGIVFLRAKLSNSGEITDTDIGYLYGDNNDDVAYMDLDNEKEYNSVVNDLENSNYPYDTYSADGGTYKRYHLPKVDIFYYDFGDDAFDQYQNEDAKYGVFSSGSTEGCYCYITTGECRCSYSNIYYY